MFETEKKPQLFSHTVIVSFVGDNANAVPSQILAAHLHDTAGLSSVVVLGFLPSDSGQVSTREV